MNMLEVKPSILIMKHWEVLHMHNFFIFINRVLYIFFMNFCFHVTILIFK
jgi:hypothetical protein